MEVIMRVEVYFKLHTGLWSVRALDGWRSGRVIGHASKVLISDATFVVQPAGREKVRREKRKHVHAFVRGTLIGALWENAVEFPEPMPWTSGDEGYARVARKRLGVEVTYNPYKDDTFVTLAPNGDRQGPIHEAPMVYLRRFDKRGVVLAFDPLDMTMAESAAATA
jgi:hypothetical protein